MRRCWGGGLTLCWLCLVMVTGGESPDSETTGYSQAYREAEFGKLKQEVEDKIGLDAIRALHKQLDDDDDGTIEPSETGDFIKADLKLSSGGLHAGEGVVQGAAGVTNPLLQYEEEGSARERNFHKKDSEITVPDLWATWVKSEVHNWTKEQTVAWLEESVDLPQYARTFLELAVDGRQLPRAASDPNYLSKVLGITNSIHRSKISLKAMDVVLFGPPKESSNWLKDTFLTVLLLLLTSALLWAYRAKRLSEEAVGKMLRDMESLAKAEEALKDMQGKLDKVGAERQREMEAVVQQHSSGAGEGPEEVGRLREEVELLRGELQRAEVELEDRCWVAPTVLQHWLQVTYELESASYNCKKKVANEQMELAKDACERLKRKRSSFVGAFVSTHGRSIDDVDKSILDAKTALVELTQDLTERSTRWRQIEMLTGVSIVNNPGLSTLQKLVRHVGGGAGRFMQRGASSLSGSRLGMSPDDIQDDLDSRSVAASVRSVAQSHTSNRSNATRASGYTSSVMGDRPARRQTGPNGSLVSSRESSKESSNSSTGEHSDQDLTSPPRLEKDVSRVSQSSVESAVSQTRSLGPGGLMMKSLSQETQDSAEAAAQRQTQPLHTSSSDSNLHSKAMASLLSVHRGLSRISPPNLSSNLSEVDESSDTGSVNDLDGKKKKKSFFNFRKKREKTSS